MAVAPSPTSSTAFKFDVSETGKSLGKGEESTTSVPVPPSSPLPSPRQSQQGDELPYKFPCCYYIFNTVLYFFFSMMKMYRLYSFLCIFLFDVMLCTSRQIKEHQLKHVQYGIRYCITLHLYHLQNLYTDLHCVRLCNLDEGKQLIFSIIIIIITPILYASCIDF